MILLIAVAVAEPPAPEVLIASVSVVVREAHAELAVLEGAAAGISAEAAQCVSDRAESIAALGQLSQTCRERHRSFTVAGEADAAQLEYRKLRIIHSKVPQLVESAARCLAPSDPAPRRRAPEPAEPDPTDVPTYYQLDAQGWVEGFSRDGP